MRTSWKIDQKNVRTNNQWEWKKKDLNVNFIFHQKAINKTQQKQDGGSATKSKMNVKWSPYKNSLMCKFIVQHFQSLIIIGQTIDWLNNWLAKQLIG